MRTGLIPLSLAATLAIVGAGTAAAQDTRYDVATQSNVEYAIHDGTKLTGELYIPKGLPRRR